MMTPLLTHEREAESRAEVVSRTLTIAGLRLHLLLLDFADVPGVDERYGYFLTPGQPDEADATIRIKHTPDVERIVQFQAPIVPSAVNAMGITTPEPSLCHLERGEEGCVSFSAPLYEGAFDGKVCEAKIFADRPAAAVEGILMATLEELTLQRQRVFMHSSGVLHEGKALLFSGRSGAGKTTAVLQSEGKTILSDELVILEYKPESDGFVAHGTPFFGTWGRIGAQASAPLHCIHFLEKTSTNQLAALPARERFRRLCQVMCFRRVTPRHTHHLLQMAERLSPYCRLFGFQPTPEIWTFLAQPAHWTKGLNDA